MIERISELPWASFEKQLLQRCENYHVAYPFAPTLTKWKCYDDSIIADEIYCIQHQILFNAFALNDEFESVPSLMQYRHKDNNDRFTDKDIYFWDDLVGERDSQNGNKLPHEGWENTREDRSSQATDILFSKNQTFRDSPKTDSDETPTELSSLPKTYASRSLIEVAEYVGPNHPDAKNSNYVSRKVSMLWFFNVIKAIVKTLHTFSWMRIGTDVKEIVCSHPEAEKDVHAVNSPHGAHSFYRSVQPNRIGYLRLYGNAEINGEVTTFHSQARFHDEVTMWDKLSVYGQSYFSKDINGTAMRVRWGDLAEYYEADAEYKAGTLVKFGGPEEVTLADSHANAVVTTNPGLVLNEQLKMRTDGPRFPVGLALVGRVPVKVWGDCKKFDTLIPDPDHPGWARVKGDLDNGEPIARALKDKGPTDDTVLCATNFKV